VDGARDGVSPLTIDLHVHSTASDGSLAPDVVVARALAAGLSAIALTDHDTVAGIPSATVAGERLGLRIVGGCEFSSLAPWGEMHVLGYFLPAESAVLEAFLQRRRDDRVRRGREMVSRLRGLGVELEFEDVLVQSRGGAVGRPHVARAIVHSGSAADISEAFDRYIGRGRPAFVEKVLPRFRDIAEVVHAVGGLVSVAHLKERGTRSFLERLKKEGLDAIEVRHPSHDQSVRARLTDIAGRLGLLRTGGSDWHGDPEPGEVHGALGSQEVPAEWLDQLEALRPVPPAPAVGP
jgi:3',5'-nucleoside bisphosphate phosphatase